MPRLTPGKPERRTTGFTLPELLVAVTLMLLVGMALNTLLTGQFRMFSRTQGATRMQRDLRTGLAVLPVDLRGAARESKTLADFTELRDSSIGLHATFGSSIVCARPAINQIDLPPLGMARNTLTTWYSEPKTGDTLLVYNDSTLAGAEDDVWTPRRITSITQVTGTCAGAPYTDPSLDAGKQRWRVVLSDKVPDGVVLGAPVRFLRSVRYSLFQPTPGSSQWYLGYRELLGGAWSLAQPIAGPFERYAAGPTSGIRFAYFDTLGQALATPVPTTLLKADIGRIDLVLRTRVLLRGGTRDSLVLRDSIATRVALRNKL